MKDKETVTSILSSFRFDPWNLAGNANKEIRRQLLAAITGERRPLAKCGVNEITKEFRAIGALDGATCAARYSDSIRQFLAC